MSEAEKREYLKRTPVFRGLSDEELDEIVPLLIERKLRGNTVVFHEGDTASAFYLVKTGRVKIYKVSPDGREQVLAILSDGQIFGDVPTFDGGPYPATAETMDDTKIFLIPREDLLGVVRRHPEIAIKVIAVLGQRLRQALELVRDLSFKQVPHRLAGLLLKLADEYGEETEKGTLINLSLSRQELADIVGTSRETVTRELKKMERNQLLRIDRRYITITDREGLKRWARL
ncbi:MAG: Crp/Fnr family transcriptional regulator [Thermoleophilia bacterium]|nr:Crp/Fnr family transcriptional regulator [Thermoleophilia bacterium]